ncbi:GSCOCG00010875001-RA-CDS, partial [Cotesia congregata]
GQIDNRGLSARSAGSAKNCSSDFGGSQSSPIRGIGCNVTESYSKDTDLLAHAASALRRLHFKSAGGSRSCRTVPKVVIMGSSTASETTINTSTDSANTQVTL